MSDLYLSVSDHVRLLVRFCISPAGMYQHVLTASHELAVIPSIQLNSWSSLSYLSVDLHTSIIINTRRVDTAMKLLPLISTSLSRAQCQLTSSHQVLEDALYIKKTRERWARDGGEQKG
jgi:hypothetical protein